MNEKKDTNSNLIYITCMYVRACLFTYLCCCITFNQISPKYTRVNNLMKTGIYRFFFPSLNLDWLFCCQLVVDKKLNSYKDATHNICLFFSLYGREGSLLHGL